MLRKILGLLTFRHPAIASFDAAVVISGVAIIFLSLYLWGPLIQSAISDPRTKQHYQPYESQMPRPMSEKWWPGGYFPDCFAPKDREDGDLCAQWAAVSAAEEANRLNRINIEAGGYQGTFLLVSIFLSAWAAYVASKAARAAEEGVEEAKRTARKQLRAYVGIEPAPNTENFILMSDQHLKCWFLIENLGNTPALNTSIDISVAYVSEEKEISLASRLDNLSISLLPSKSRKMSIISETPIDEGMQSSILLHWAEILVSGKVDYDDIYGTQHTTYFSFYARGQDNFDEKRLSISPQGNYVT